MGKADLLAVRSDKKECVVTHLDILSDSSFRRSRIAKEGRRCIKVSAAGLSLFPMLNQGDGSGPRIEERVGTVQTKLLAQNSCVRLANGSFLELMAHGSTGSSAYECSSAESTNLSLGPT